MTHRHGRMRMSVAIGQVDIGSVINNPTVDLFRNTYVEAAIPGFHVKYRNLPPLRRDDGQAAVGVSQHEESSDRLAASTASAAMITLPMTSRTIETFMSTSFDCPTSSSCALCDV